MDHFTERLSFSQSKVFTKKPSQNWWCEKPPSMLQNFRTHPSCLANRRGLVAVLQSVGRLHLELTAVGCGRHFEYIRFFTNGAMQTGIVRFAEKWVCGTGAAFHDMPSDTLDAEQVMQVHVPGCECPPDEEAAGCCCGGCMGVATTG